MKQTETPAQGTGQALPIQKMHTLKKFQLKTADTGLQMPLEKIVSSLNVYDVIKKIHTKEGNDFQEFFYVVFLNRANKPTGYYLASMGGVTGTVADPRLIVKAAALSDCCAVILSHNHPSGAVVPSQADICLTIKLKEALSFFDIKVIDHLIYGEDVYYSFADEGQIF